MQAYSSSPPVGTVFENCSDAYRRGYALIPRGAPGYAPKLDGDDDGVACEDPPGGSGTRSSTAVASTSGSAGTAGLAATGSSVLLPLSLFGVGLILAGASAMTSDAGRRWYATADPNVRYTIDSVSRKCRR